MLVHKDLLCLLLICWQQMQWVIGVYRRGNQNERYFSEKQMLQSSATLFFSENPALKKTSITHVQHTFLHHVALPLPAHPKRHTKSSVFIQHSLSYFEPQRIIHPTSLCYSLKCAPATTTEKVKVFSHPPDICQALEILQLPHRNEP